jgi:hypothetical protein
MTELRQEAARKRRHERIDRQLDEALEESFPASDPVSIVTSQDEEDWRDEDEEPGESQAPGIKAPSAPESNPPDSRS